MKNNLKKGAVTMCEKIFTSMAKSTSASACLTSFYQPKEPKSLTKK
ncbi:MAG: cyclic lactone autoinducer peptide [Bacillota bacterium]|nr:cyclic lactone autoinducer peptide [Bacillota bacterium]MDP4145354.1 cyclic lactone autoinducer peptide [Bacillota bacterium]